VPIRTAETVETPEHAEILRELELLRARLAELEGHEAAQQRQAAETLYDLEFRLRAVAGMGRLAARIAHDINNPLAGIKSAFALVRDAIPADIPEYEYVGLIEQEIERIANVVRQMYELYGDRSGEAAWFDVHRVLFRALESLQQVASDRGVQLRYDDAAELPRVRLPEGDVRRIVLNVVENAIEASPAGADVAIDASHDNGRIRIRVSDRGPGIPGDQLPQIFEPFFTTKGDPSRGALGLGLTVCRNLVALMGGRIDVETEPGCGSRFVIVLPCDLSAVAVGRRSG
jgi:signal transduction histidine kinase